MNKEFAITTAQEWIENNRVAYTRAIEFIQKLPDDMPGRMTPRFNGIGITIPRNIETLRDVRREISKIRKFRLEKKTEFETGTLEIQYKSTDGEWFDVSVWMAIEGSNCKRVLVGEETEVKKVYKVVCE
jgi:hypothetical protein